MLGQLLGELEAEDLRALAGLEQRLLALFVGARLFKVHHLTACWHADHGLTAQLGQPEEEAALEVQDGLGGRSGASLVTARAGNDI